MSIVDVAKLEPLYTAAQTRALDRSAIDEHGIPGIVLMSRAARAAFQRLLMAWPETGFIQVVCGTGNNGGDGFLLADLAHKSGIRARVLQVGDAGKISGDALLARRQAQANGVDLRPFACGELQAAGVVVDALLGTGLGGAVRGDAVAAIEAINAATAPVLAVDIPSGLCSDSGRILGAAVRADLTVSFIGRKRGLFTLDAADCCGDLQFADLGVPAGVYRAVPAAAHRLELGLLLDALPRRPASAHKGSCGRVLVVGGDRGMAGAAAMAAEAALRCGAGLVRVATRAEHVAPLVARTPEVMVSAVESGGELGPLLAAADVVVAGPGLGQSPWSHCLLQASVASGKPMVLDADGLNLLAAGEAGPAANTVITPHPGEAARLLGSSTPAVQADRFAAVRSLQALTGGVAVLKGSGSLIADREHCLLSDYGNPGMAAGGMGDVLSGVIGSLLAQGLSPLDAAALGVCLHGAAGDSAAGEGLRGLAATDLMPRLRELLG